MFPGYDEFQAQQYAAAWPKLRPVAEAGNLDAQVMVGNFYQLGFDVVEIDEAEAARWYEKASVQGYGLASSNLAGIRFIEGDYEESNRLYRLAHEQGFPHGRAFV